MTRRRLAALVLTATLVGGLGAAHVAGADPVVGTDAIDTTASTVGASPVPADQALLAEILSMREEYWACLALDQVDLGTCLENPLPDLSQVPSVPELLGALLGAG